jgi:hypothetical protein
MSTGKIKTLYSDREKTEALFPRTKINAISDDNGVGLDAILEHVVYSVPDVIADNTDTVNADTLQGHPASDFATPTFVTAKIAEAQLSGGDSGDIDLSGYATKDELAAIDFPVDSVNGKTGDVILSATDVGALPNTGGDVNGTVTVKSGRLQTTLDGVGHASIAGLSGGAFFEAFKDNYDIRRQLVMNNPENADINTALVINQCTDGTNWDGAYILHTRNIGTYAAPAGFGLGGTVPFKTFNSASELDGLWQNGWYMVYFPNNAVIGGVPMNYIQVRVWSYDEGHVIQEIMPLGTPSMLRRTRFSHNTFSEWDWVNPPMWTGVEFRTTERYNGKTVYAKLIDCGQVTAGGETVVNVSLGTIIRCEANNQWASLPMHQENTNGYKLYVVSAEPNQIRIYAGSAHTNVRVHVQVWYTKE